MFFPMAPGHLSMIPRVDIPLSHPFSLETTQFPTGLAHFLKRRIPEENGEGTGSIDRVERQVGRCIWWVVAVAKSLDLLNSEASFDYGVWGKKRRLSFGTYNRGLVWVSVAVSSPVPG